MTVLNLAALKPAPGTGGDANAMSNAFTAIEAAVNAIDSSNLAAGKVLPLSKLTQDAATVGQVPVWDVASSTWKPGTAGAVEATTVAGLGTGADGKLGQIRAGTTPFDFVTVVYDATYGKWVSLASLGRSGTFHTTTGSTTDAAIDSDAGYAKATIPHKVFTDAGLSLQIRVMGTVFIAGNTGTWSVAGLPQNDGDTALGTIQRVDLFSGAFATATFKDSGWLAMSPATPKTMLHLRLDVRQNAGANTVNTSLALYYRWVG